LKTVGLVPRPLKLTDRVSGSFAPHGVSPAARNENAVALVALAPGARAG